MTRYPFNILLVGALFGVAACDAPQETTSSLSTKTGALEEEAVVQRVKRTDFVPVAEQTNQPEPEADPARQEKTYDQAGLLRLVQEDPRFAGMMSSMRRSQVDPNTRPRHHAYREEGCAQGRLGEAAELASPPPQLEARTSRDRSDVPHEQRLSHLPAHDLDQSDEPSAPQGE